MNALGVWGQFFSMAILGLVLWAAVSDLLFRRIPNAAVVSIVLVEAAALAAASLAGNGTAALGLPLLRMIETKTGFWAERLAEAFGRPLECTPIGLLGGEAQKGLPYGLAIAAGFAAVQFGVFSHIF